MSTLRSRVWREFSKVETWSRLVLLGAVWIAFPVLNPGFASWDAVFSVLQGAALLGLIAIGLGVAMIAGELDLSVASVAAVSGIFAVKFIGFGLVPAILLASAISAGFGAVQGFCIARLKISSLVFTIGTLFALRGVANLLTNSQSVLMPIDKLNLSDELIKRLFVFSPFSMVTIVVVVMAGAGLALTRWGRELYAIGGARRESAAAGVPQRRPIVLAFTVSGFTAGLAGALAGVVAGSGSAQAYSNYLLLGVTAALVGGIGLYGGTGTMMNIALGTLILQSFIAGLVDQNASQDIQQLATGGLLLLVIVVEFATMRDDGGRMQLIRRWLVVRPPAGPGGVSKPTV